MLPSFPFMWDGADREADWETASKHALGVQKLHRNMIPSFRQLWSPQGNWCHQLVISNGSRSKTYSFPLISIFIRKIRVWVQFCFHRNQHEKYPFVSSGWEKTRNSFSSSFHLDSSPPLVMHLYYLVRNRGNSCYVKVQAAYSHISKNLAWKLEELL